MNETDNQLDNNKPWLWKKGQSGNILGRPKGKTMKEWAKEYLAKMNDDERDEFMHGIPKEIIWKMSEGNPTSEETMTLITPNINIAEEIATKYAIAPSSSKDNS